MAKRIGVSTLMRVAHEMCKYIVLFSPLIQHAFPDNLVLQAALEAALLACQELEKELVKVQEAGH